MKRDSEKSAKTAVNNAFLSVGAGFYGGIVGVVK